MNSLIADVLSVKHLYKWYKLRPQVCIKTQFVKLACKGPMFYLYIYIVQKRLDKNTMDVIKCTKYKDIYIYFRTNLHTLTHKYPFICMLIQTHKQKHIDFLSANKLPMPISIWSQVYTYVYICVKSIYLCMVNSEANNMLPNIRYYIMIIILYHGLYHDTKYCLLVKIPFMSLWPVYSFRNQNIYNSKMCFFNLYNWTIFLDIKK